MCKPQRAETPQTEMDRVVEEYKASTDEDLVNFAQSVRDKKSDHLSSRMYSIGEVSVRATTEINSLTDVDITRYKHNINGGAIKHIEDRHGPKGTADHSMADINDYGRIKYVLDNYDKLTLLRDAKGEVVYNYGYLDSKGKPSPIVKYEKRVNGNFCVAEAVPDTKTKTLQIVSAYKERADNGGGAQSLNMATKAPQFTSEQLGSLRTVPPPAIPPTL
jgi:hypothetical protein